LKLPETRHYAADVWCLVAARIGMTVSIPQAHIGPVLGADRSDLELTVLALQKDAVVVAGLGMDDFAQI
jgi:hypothetical protein